MAGTHTIFIMNFIKSLRSGLANTGPAGLAPMPMCMRACVPVCMCMSVPLCLCACVHVCLHTGNNINKLSKQTHLCNECDYN